MTSVKKKIPRNQAMKDLKNGKLTQQEFDWMERMEYISGNRVFTSRKIETKSGEMATLKKPTFCVDKKHVKQSRWTPKMIEFDNKVEELWIKYSTLTTTELVYS